MAREFSKRFYNSKAWRDARKQVMLDRIYTCHDCGGFATEVHHIVELTPENINDPCVALNPENLMAICWTCHNKRTLGVGDVPDGYSFDENGQLVREIGPE